MPDWGEGELEEPYGFAEIVERRTAAMNILSEEKELAVQSNRRFLDFARDEKLICDC
jgi:hypothetical protein